MATLSEIVRWWRRFVRKGENGLGDRRPSLRPMEFPRPQWLGELIWVESEESEETYTQKLRIWGGLIEWGLPAPYFYPPPPMVLPAPTLSFDPERYVDIEVPTAEEVGDDTYYACWRATSNPSLGEIVIRENPYLDPDYGDAALRVIGILQTQQMTKVDGSTVLTLCWSQVAHGSLVLTKPAPWTLVPKLTSGSYRIYIPDGSLIIYLISTEHGETPVHSVSETSVKHDAEPKHIVDVGRGVVAIDPPEDAFGDGWYTVELSAGHVYVSIEKGVVKITNDPSKYSSRIARIVDPESGNIEQIASSTITLLVEEDSPDAPEKDDELEDPPPCGHPGNKPYEDYEGDEDHPGDNYRDPRMPGSPDHPGYYPSPVSGGECE